MLAGSDTFNRQPLPLCSSSFITTIRENIINYTFSYFYFLFVHKSNKCMTSCSRPPCFPPVPSGSPWAAIFLTVNIRKKNCEQLCKTCKSHVYNDHQAWKACSVCHTDRPAKWCAFCVWKKKLKEKNYDTLFSKNELKQKSIVYVASSCRKSLKVVFGNIIGLCRVSIHVVFVKWEEKVKKKKLLSKERPWLPSN